MYENDNYYNTPVTPQPDSNNEYTPVPPQPDSNNAYNPVTPAAQPVYNQAPPPPQPVPVVKNTQKKYNYKYIMLALCLVCALAGGVIGGAVSGAVVRKSVSNTINTVSSETAATSPSTTEKTDEEKTQPATAPSEESSDDDIRSGVFTSSDDKPSPDTTLSAKEIYKNNVDSVVSIEVRSGYSIGYGTGFIISEEGYIVTNYHVVENTQDVNVTLYDDSSYSATVVGYEESNDLAILKINPTGKIESLVYGSSSDLCVGDDVFVIGNPLGDLTFTLTTGVVSALNRPIDTGAGFTINMFQTDAAVNSGNSGGPVFDSHGYVVGIASAKYASSSIEGLSFCVPIDDVRSMIDEIINKGYVSGKPILGATVYDTEITSFGFLQSSRRINGAKIAAMDSDSAAAKAGLQEGDIIIALNSNKITSVSDLRSALCDYRSGDTVTLGINRNGTSTTVILTLDEYEPTSPRTNYSNAYDL